MMSNTANIDSFDAIKAFRAALIKFASAAGSSLTEAEAEMVRTLHWLDREQGTYWQNQIRKRQEFVSRCKEGVRQKKVFKDATGRTTSAIDEEKALQKALKHLDDAEQKLVAVRKWKTRLQKEIDLYKGSVQGFATAIESDVPSAVATLDKALKKLEAYVALKTPELAPTPAPAEGDSSMTRPQDVEVPQLPPEAGTAENASAEADPTQADP
jgi:hypothetical protein